MEDIGLGLCGSFGGGSGGSSGSGMTEEQVKAIVGEELKTVETNVETVAKDVSEVEENINDIDERITTLEEVQASVVNDNLILHSEAMDFPELIDEVERIMVDTQHPEFGYDIVTDEDGEMVRRLPSQKALIIRQPNSLTVNCTFSISKYIVETIKTRMEEQFFTLSFYYSRQNIQDTQFEVSVNGRGVNELDTIDEQQPHLGPEFYKRTILFSVNVSTIPEEVDVEVRFLINNWGYYGTHAWYFSSLKLERGKVGTCWVETKESDSSSSSMMTYVTKTGEQTLFIEPTRTGEKSLVIITGCVDDTSLNKVEMLCFNDDGEFGYMPVSLGMAQPAEVNPEYNDEGVFCLRMVEGLITDEQRMYICNIIIIGDGFTCTVE